MTRTVLILLAVCVALVSATIATVMTRDLIPAAPFPARPMTAALAGSSPNTDGKRDKLPLVVVSPAPVEADPALPLRQAYASDSPLLEPSPPIAGPVPMPRARGASRPAIQKNYTLLSDIQIAAIKGRLKLSSAQEALWPGVETALRAFARTMHDRRQANPSGLPSIEAESAEVEQLKAAALPLIAQLREDQKREVRALARIIGLEAVASQI